MINLLKNEKTEKTVKLLKIIYLCVFTFFLVSREIVLLDFIIGNLFFTAAFMGGAVLFIAYDILTNRFCIKTRYFAAAVVFLAITLISCIINYKYGIFSNLKGIATFIIYFFLLYPEAFSENRDKTFSKCLNTAFFSIGVYSFFSIPMYFFNLYYYTTEQKTQGFSPNSNRLWGLYQDPNYLALYSLLAIFAAVYLFIKTNRIWLKILYVLVSVIHIITLSMTGSRMGTVCFIIALFWIATVICANVIKAKLYIRVLAFLLGAVLSLAIPFGTVEVLGASMPSIKKGVLNTISAESYVSVRKAYHAVYRFCKIDAEYHDPALNIENYPFNDEINKIDRTDADPDDMSNGRLDRWIDGLKLLAEKPFFGLSPRNIFSFADESDTNTLMGENDYSIHNTYIEILAGAGLIGGLFIIVFMFLAAFFVLKRVFKTTPDLKTIISTTFVIIIALSAILLPDIIFFQLTFAGLMFWIALGNCLNTDPENYKNSLTLKLYEKYLKRKSKI